MSELTKTVCIDPDNPKTSFEVEMVAASEHAMQHLYEGYMQAMECGLNTSLAKSQGVLWACTQLLTHHLMQHLGNQMAPADALERELENFRKNISGIFEKEYPSILEASLAACAAENTKQ
jgi:hypothetical protein